MFARMAVVAAAIGLASCAGLEPAGRNANRSPSPAATAPAPRPAQTPAATPAPAPPPQTQAAPVAAPPPTAAPRPAATPAPTPAPQQAAPPVAAPRVSVPTPPPPTPARAQSDSDDIVVPGQVQTQVPPPAGDPRTNEERRADVRAWDQCITQVQGAFDSDPMSPQLTTPEEYCATSLGMAERTAVPVSRSQRRR
jgi:hypothetical protein